MSKVSKRKKVLHIITGLNNGGAEAVLYRLCTHDKNNRHVVISLMDEGKYGPLLNEAGIDVHCLDMQAGRVSIVGLYKLFKLLRSLKPDVVQTWMYHADLIGGLVARLAGIKNVYWNIRHTTLDPEHSKRSTILIAKLCAKLSTFVPKGVICCAEKAVEVHSKIGYSFAKMTVISNGYNLSNLKIMPDAQKILSEELGDIFPIIGMVGRFDPQKDHFGLLSAFSILKKGGVSYKLALVGRDLNSVNLTLIEKIKALDLNGEVLLLDQRKDIPVIMNSLTLHVLSSSFGEAFPNVLAEAMACGTPCVTTDVGDAARIVGHTGWVVPPKDPKALANAISEALHEKECFPEQWAERKKACRERIVENFSIDTMVDDYQKNWSIE
ncbi:glycosyltransferase family 4 protein [Marinomonas flavescens]|uniref:glycosyltransferase family 4 protein n=1 Tax=Marinomonas flavescens TaxID=2529379 RepID=UPI001F0B6CE3|nr:glycosyltransferase [Marinomonas flavescens]